jgi:hypothetical protein
VVSPDEEPDPGDRDHRKDHEVISEDAAAREVGDDFGTTPIAGSTMMYTAGRE